LIRRDRDPQGTPEIEPKYTGRRPAVMAPNQQTSQVQAKRLGTKAPTSRRAALS
jgi:hypothetical protein